MGLTTAQPSNRSKRKRYTHYVHARVRIRFHHKPTLGWIYSGYYDKDRRFYAFPREDHTGNIPFDSKYWRGMFGNALVRYFSDTILTRNPYAMREIRIADVAASVPLGHASEFGAVYEQLPLNFELETIFTFPPELMSMDELTRVLEVCGRHVGWAPVHAEEGYGQFLLVLLNEVQA